MKEHVFLESTAALTSVINIQDIYWEKSDKSPLANHLFNELKGASYFAKSAAVLLTPPLTNTLVARLGNPGLT